MTEALYQPGDFSVTEGDEDNHHYQEWAQARVLMQNGKDMKRKPPPESAYICGPMRGFPEHNYPAFNAVAKNRRELNWKIRNPAENFGGDQTRTTEEYMGQDLLGVIETEAIILLPGWRNSELGRLEATVAKTLGHRFYEATLPEHEHDDDGTVEGCPGCFAEPEEPLSWKIAAIDTPEYIGAEGPDTHARNLVYGARNATYGPPVLDFTVVGRIWAAILSAHLQIHVSDIPPDVVAVMLTGLKLGRQGRTPSHYDSRVDVIGYQLCLDRIVTDDGKKGRDG